MKVRVLYFAALREKVGKSGEELSLDGDAPTVETLLAALRGRGGVWQAALSPENAIKCAVNRRLSAQSAPLADDAEVALFPPLTGG